MLSNFAPWPTILDQLCGIDGGEDPKAEKVWTNEVRRRSRELGNGKVTPISADEVFARVRADL